MKRGRHAGKACSYNWWFRLSDDNTRQPRMFTPKWNKTQKDRFPYEWRMTRHDMHGDGDADTDTDGAFAGLVHRPSWSNAIRYFNIMQMNHQTNNCCGLLSLDSIVESLHLDCIIDMYLPKRTPTLRFCKERRDRGPFVVLLLRSTHKELLLSLLVFILALEFLTLQAFFFSFSFGASNK